MPHCVRSDETPQPACPKCGRSEIHYVQCGWDSVAYSSCNCHAETGLVSLAALIVPGLAVSAVACTALMLLAP